MTTVLAAIDNSLAARPVLAMAKALARVFGSDVVALHVTDDDGQTAEASAETFDLPLRTPPGDPLKVITEQAESNDVVAVVIGARDHRSARTGHLAREVADAIDKPVLVVPPTSEPPERLHTVVIAMEGSPRKVRDLSRTMTLGAEADLELVVVHVDDEDHIPSFSDQLAHETDTYAGEFLARHVHGAPKARLELRVGVPADEILAAVDSAMADLLAIGWPHPRAEHRGAVACELLDRSRVPVLLVALGNRKKEPAT